MIEIQRPRLDYSGNALWSGEFLDLEDVFSADLHGNANFSKLEQTVALND